LSVILSGAEARAAGRAESKDSYPARSMEAAPGHSPRAVALSS